MNDPTPRRRWTRNELICTFNLYCRMPFGKIHNRNPAVISLAETLGRSASAVSWKLANFARLDPTLAKRNIKGASHGSKEEEVIWREFESNWEGLAFESERLRLGEDAWSDVGSALGFPEGQTRESLVRVRVNQTFFRQAVLNAYNSVCCVTGIEAPELLCASHIVPWSVDVKNRTNPSNGLCLNAFHDRAFDRGLMTINDDFTIRVSSKIVKLESLSLKTMLLDFQGKAIAMPRHFVPRLEFLEHHRSHIFQR